MTWSFANVQRNGHHWHAFLVEVLQSSLFVALLNAPQVGAENIAIHFPLFTLSALLQFLLLQVDLSCNTVGGVGEEFQQVGTAVLHTLNMVALCVELIQQLAVSLVLTGHHGWAVLMNIKEGEILWFAFCIDDSGWGAAVVHHHIFHPA